MKIPGRRFDDARLDTLFLALPISRRGTLIQYAGRLHRLNESKKEVIIYDYGISMCEYLHGCIQGGEQGIRQSDTRSKCLPITNTIANYTVETIVGME
jgi:superfamily II DNA or RNA helicase